MNDYRPSRRLLNWLTAEMVTWLEQLTVDQVRSTVRAWDERVWLVAEKVALMQGIGPYLHDRWAGTPLHAALPDRFRRWLAAQHEMNGERVRRLHEDLAAILRSANRAGIPVMPLKGSLLTAGYYSSLALRPMADLDLLIRPEDGPAMAAMLESMGYHREAAAGPHSSVRAFTNPGRRQIVSSRHDHVDNPRPVEVHVDLRRTLWVKYATYDLTAYTWSGSREGELLGERAWLPARDRLAAHLAVHAFDHHLFGTGRLISLLDLARVLPLPEGWDPPHANWIYPSLRLAARVMPGQLGAVDLSALARRTPPRLRHWAETVPLDGRCGLSLNLVPPSRQNRWRLRWVRWHPTPARLALAYDDTPLLLAYGRHLVTIARYLGRRAASN